MGVKNGRNLPAQEQILKDLLDKLSSYNIFNFLLPGVVFAVFASKATSFKLMQEDVLSSAFVYYFIGAIISRIGSLVVEPALKATKLVTFASYKDFVVASKSDEKIEVLSETNNMYRTICALLLCVGIAYILEIAMTNYSLVTTAAPYTGLLLLLVIFVWSYRKQTSYINKRIAANLEENEK